MTFGKNRYGSSIYGTQPYAGELPTAIGISADLAGVGELVADVGIILAISAALEGVGAFGATIETPVPIALPPGLTVRAMVRSGVRR